MEPKLVAVVARARNGVIGVGNGLLANLRRPIERARIRSSALTHYAWKESALLFFCRQLSGQQQTHNRPHKSHNPNSISIRE